jgi:CxxC motif-containing protein (DUF1111 family)
LGTEWRTARNIGLTASETSLHDGLAPNLNEEIIWHGDEAEASKQIYADMTQYEKDALIAFLKTW